MPSHVSNDDFDHRNLVDEKKMDKPVSIYDSSYPSSSFLHFIVLLTDENQFFLSSTLLLLVSKKGMNIK